MRSTSQVIDLVVVLFLLPEREVLLQQLDDALGVTEVVLLELIDLVESRLESVVCELAGLRVVLQHLVVEDGEVKSETKLDWVARWQLNGVSLFVRLSGLLLNILEELVLRVLSNVAVVIADHLDEKGLGLIGAASLEHAGVDHVDNLLAVLLELRLDLTLVCEQSTVELGVFRVLLDRRDRTARSAFRRNQVLESDGKKVALVGIDLATLDDKDLLKEVDHVLEALCLLGDAGQENLLFDVDHLFVD